MNEILQRSQKTGTMRRRMKISATLLVLLASGAGLAFYGTQSRGNAVVPGRSVGPIKIGMPMDEAAKILEQYGKIEWDENRRSSGCVQRRESGGSGVFSPLYCIAETAEYLDGAYVSTPTKVAVIQTRDSRYIGEQKQAFLRRLGKPTYQYGAQSDSVVVWEEKGLALHSGLADGRVTRLIVFVPRK